MGETVYLNYDILMSQGSEEVLKINELYRIKSLCEYTTNPFF